MRPDRALTEASGRRTDDEFHSCSASDRRGLLVQGVRIQGGVAVPEAAVGRAPWTRWFGATLKNFHNRYTIFHVSLRFCSLFSPLFRDLHVACIMYSFHRVSISLTIDKIQHKKEKPTQWSVLVHRYFGTLHDTIMTTNVESVANLWEYAMCVFETVHVSPREFEWIFWIFEAWIDRKFVKKERKKKRGERSIAAANIQKRWARIKMDDILL